MMAAQAAYEMTCGDFDELDKCRLARAGDDPERVECSRHYRLVSVPHRRWAGGFACLCFAMVGVPMAIRLRNRDFLTSFFLCYLPILIVYYPAMIYGADQAKNGNLPVIFVWAGNGLLLLWGLWLLRRAALSIYPPAIAPTTRNASAPRATASGSGAFGGSWDRSRRQAKNRRNALRWPVTWSRIVPRSIG